MKKLILSLMVLLSSLSFSAKKFYVGTNAEFMPYEYLENGKIVGFDVELMEAIGKELDYEIVWSNLGFDGLLPALQMKKIDAVIIADVSGDEYLKVMKKIKKIDVVIDDHPGASIALRKGETELAEKINQAILTLDANGTYLKLLEKYFPEKVEKYHQLKNNQ